MSIEIIQNKYEFILTCDTIYVKYFIYLWRLNDVSL